MATKTFVSGNWVGGVWNAVGDPVASDDCLLNDSSGNCVINTGAVGRSLNCTGYTGTLSQSDALTIGDGTTGNVTFAAGMTYSSPGTITLASTAAGNTLTSTGKTLGFVNVNGTGGEWTLQDALNASTGLQLQSGSLVTNSQAVTCQSLITSGATTRSLTLGSSVITITGSSTVWSAINGRNSTSAGITFDCGTSVICFTDTSSTDKAINNANLTYHIFRLTMGGTGAFKFLGAGTFYAIQTTGTPAAITLKFTHTTTYTFTGPTPLPSGTSGALVTLCSSTDNTAYTFNLSGQTISVDYMNVRDLTVTNGTLYCGTHSTDSGGNNANVIFTDPPAAASNPQAQFGIGTRIGI